MKQIYVMRGTHKHMRGFEYLVYSAFSLSLLVVLLLLPLAPVFADELSSETTSVESTSSSVSESTPVQESEVVEEVLAVVEDEISPVYDLVPEVPVVLDDAGTVEEVVSDTTDIADSQLEPIDGSLDVLIDPSQGTSSEDGEVVIHEGDTVTESEQDAGTTTEPEAVDDIEDVPVDEVLDETLPLPEVPLEKPVDAEDTDVVSEELPDSVVSVVTNDENRFTFSKDECTLAGDGAFYCAKGTPEAQVMNADRIFAAPDVDGDKEIYIEKDAELTAITANTIDDDAPYFDEASNTIVWQRLVDYRYQIISYDVETGEETQLTSDRFNNMQPSRFGKATVWQGWVGDDWEIFYLDGNELTMLTDNTTHDITPSVNGTHIVWQAFEGNVWNMKVYDIRTGGIETIENTEGGSIENPRFVLVYDTKFETGDIETKGYDLKSGKVLDLGSQPAPIPEDIPSPEQTGEERALVSAPTQPKSKTDGEDLDDMPSDEPEPLPTDIVIPALNDVVDATSTDSGNDIINTDELPLVDSPIVDVVITPFAEDIGVDTAHIEDVIVTPYVEPIVESDSALSTPN